MRIVDGANGRRGRPLVEGPFPRLSGDGMITRVHLRDSMFAIGPSALYNGMIAPLGRAADEKP